MPNFRKRNLATLRVAEGVFVISAKVYFLGFDVSKAKLDVSFIDERGIEQWHDRFPNTATDVVTFLLTLTGSYAGDEITCVVESTGSYHYTVLEGAAGQCAMSLVQPHPYQATNQRDSARQKD